MIRAFAVAALLRALVSWVALALEGALGINAAAISAQPDILALVNVCQGRNRQYVQSSEHVISNKPLTGLGLNIKY